MGSPALLVREFVVDERGQDQDVELYDLHVDDWEFDDMQRTLLEDRDEAFLIGCKHPEHVHLRFPPGSIVIDPFRYMPDGGDWRVIRLGEAKK